MYTLTFFWISQDTAVRKPLDPDEDLKLMAQEVRDYVEAVLNSLAANIPKVCFSLLDFQLLCFSSCLLLSLLIGSGSVSS
jgi:hypothetical protein